MSAFRIFQSANPMPRHGPLQDMDPRDARAWQLTRERKPQLYEKDAR